MQQAQEQKAARFRALHDGEPFVIPNPWDAGSARAFEALGFQALATTSSGFAFTLGRPDGSVTLDELAAHAQAVDCATSLPVSVDLENGFGPRPEDAAEAILRAASAGAVGGSIEDYDPEGGIYPIDLAVERVAAAVEVSHRLDFPFVVTARAENHIRGNPDLDGTIDRLQAFERVGADVLFAPGLGPVELEVLCAAVSRPVNALARPGLRMAEMIEAGVQRISVGGALAWAGIEAAVEAAERIRDDGDFSGLRTPARAREWLAGSP